jgi:hypothetical protein
VRSTPVQARRCAAQLTLRRPGSAQLLRRTAVSDVARLAGYRVAQTFAGHTHPHVTGRYLQATIAQVATVIATLNGESHPSPHQSPDPASTRLKITDSVEARPGADVLLSGACEQGPPSIRD